MQMPAVGDAFELVLADAPRGPDAAVLHAVSLVRQGRGAQADRLGVRSVAQRVAIGRGSVEPCFALLGAQDVFEALGHLWTGPEVFMLEVIATWPRYVAAQRDSSTG